MQKIAIHSVPRSGSTWLGSIINSHSNVNFKYQPLFSYAFKGYLNSHSTLLEINKFFNDITVSNDDFLNQKKEVDEGHIPAFKKGKTISHICYKEVRYHHILENMLLQCSDLKLILLVRNPLAVLQSWFTSPKEFRIDQGWVFEDEWLDASKKNLNRPEEFNGFNKWKEATMLFIKLMEMYPKQVVIITYNQLLKDTLNTISQLFEFTNLKLEEQTLSFINESQTVHQSNSYSIYKKRENDNSWENLPTHIIDYITCDLKDTKLEKYLHE